MPAEDPGPPFYARVGYQLLERDGWVAIPFYRSPDLVPADFNLLDFFHVPGPAGPGAFAAPLDRVRLDALPPDGAWLRPTRSLRDFGSSYTARRTGS